MAKDKPSLTGQQAALCAARLPEAIRTALAGESLTGYDVCLSGVRSEELCHPLTKEQLAQLHACPSLTRREAEITHLPDARRAAQGLLFFRVRYDLAGYDGDGNPLAAQAEGVVGLRCHVYGGGAFPETVRVTDVEPCRLREDGSFRRPGWLVRSLRRRMRMLNRATVGDTAGELLLELLGAAFELLLEALFDG